MSHFPNWETAPFDRAVASYLACSKQTAGIKRNKCVVKPPRRSGLGADSYIVTSEVGVSLGGYALGRVGKRVRAAGRIREEGHTGRHISRLLVFDGLPHFFSSTPVGFPYFNSSLVKSNVSSNTIYR